MKRALAIFLLLVCVGSAAQVVMLARRPQAAAAAFSPIDISGCVFWVAADQSELSGYTNGQPVGTWTDHGSLGWNLATTTETNKPYYTNAAKNGKPGLIYDLSKRQSLAKTAAVMTNVCYDGNWVHFVVMSGAERNGMYTYYWWAATTNLLKIQLDANLIITGNNDQLATSGGARTLYTNYTCNLWEISHDGANGMYVHTNGAQALSDLTVNNGVMPGSSTLTVGYTGIGAYAGVLYEIIFYNRYLTSDERNQVRAYLNTKYAIY